MCVCVCVLSRIWLLATPWTVARQAPLPMEFSRQNTGADCHFLLQGIVPTQGSNPGLLHRQVGSSPLRYLGSCGRSVLAPHSSLRCVLSHFSGVWLSVTPWPVARQAPCPQGFSRREHWSGCHASSGVSSWPNVWTWVPYVSCIAGGFFTTSTTWEALVQIRWRCSCRQLL